MNKFTILAAAVTLNAFAPVIHAATTGNSTAKLNACQNHFGQSGQETHIYGVLPLQLDYFSGTVQIGERTQPDEVTALTPGRQSKKYIRSTGSTAPPFNTQRLTFLHPNVTYSKNH